MTDDPRAAAFERDKVLDDIIAELKYQHGPYCDEVKAIQLLRIHARSAEAEIERLKAAPPAERTTRCPDGHQWTGVSDGEDFTGRPCDCGQKIFGKAAPPAEGPTNRLQPINYAASDRPELIALNSAGLNPAQLQTAKDWAADDRLWTTQETAEFNLLTFARDVLSKAEGPTWQPIETVRPTSGESLLFFSADGDGPFVGWKNDAGSVFAIQEPCSVRRDATHWMPLPTPPRPATRPGRSKR